MKGNEARLLLAQHQARQNTDFFNSISAEQTLKHSAYKVRSRADTIWVSAYSVCAHLKPLRPQHLRVGDADYADMLFNDAKGRIKQPVQSFRFDQAHNLTLQSG